MCQPSQAIAAGPATQHLQVRRYLRRRHRCPPSAAVLLCIGGNTNRVATPLLHCMLHSADTQRTSSIYSQLQCC